MTMSAVVLPEERQRAILSLVERDGRVLAAELARAFGTSEDTIRRDLRELAQAGQVQRVHGGAVRPMRGPVAYVERERTQSTRKDALAKLAVSLIRPRELVIVDAGSTNLAIVRNLPPGLEVTIVTNSPTIAAALLGQERIEVIMLGGCLSHRVGASLGPDTDMALRQIRADLCMLGTCSLSAEGGVGCSFPDEAVIKRTMIEVSARVVAAVLNDKLGTDAPFRVSPCDSLDQVVVEADAPAAMVEKLKQASDIEILHAPGASS